MSGKMNKLEIETFVSTQVNDAIETAIRDCVGELNSQGCRFETVDDFIQEWIDPDSGYHLSIHCTLGVHASDEPDLVPEKDPVIESFFIRAISGSDPEAELLNLMEGDISNGGFHQLYDNKGVDFMEEATELLERIDSKTALKLVREALALIEKNTGVIKGFDRLCKDLYGLDEQYYAMKESVPALFEKFKDQST